MLEKKNWLQILGLAATVVGACATLMTSWVDDKKMEQAIEDKVNQAFEQRAEES